MNRKDQTAATTFQMLGIDLLLYRECVEIVLLPRFEGLWSFGAVLRGRSLRGLSKVPQIAVWELQNCVSGKSRTKSPRHSPTHRGRSGHHLGRAPRRFGWEYQRPVATWGCVFTIEWSPICLTQVAGECHAHKNVSARIRMKLSHQLARKSRPVGMYAGRAPRWISNGYQRPAATWRCAFTVKGFRAVLLIR